MHLDTIVIIVSFLLNILISFYGIVADKQAFSLNKIFWIFNLLFLSIVPFGQFLLGEFPWGRSFTNQTILFTNGLILLCQIVYVFVRQKTNNKTKETPNKTVAFSFKKKTIIYSLLFCLCITHFTIKRWTLLGKKQWHFDRKRNDTTIGR